MNRQLRDHYYKLLKDNRTRSILKAFSYRIGSVILTILISFFVTGSIKFALAIGGIDTVTKFLFYYIHERIWHYSRIGRYD